MSGRWIVPGALAACALAQVIVYATTLHRSDAQIRTTWKRGEGADRLSALHVLANRGEPDEALFSLAFVEALLVDPDPRVHEFAYTNDVCKFGVLEPQAASLRGLGTSEPGDFWRRFFLHKTKVGRAEVGSGVRMQRLHLRWFLETAAGRPPSAESVRSEIRRLAAEYGPGIVDARGFR